MGPDAHVPGAANINAEQKPVSKRMALNHNHLRPSWSRLYQTAGDFVCLMNIFFLFHIVELFLHISPQKTKKHIFAWNFKGVLPPPA